MLPRSTPESDVDAVDVRAAQRAGADLERPDVVGRGSGVAIDGRAAQRSGGEVNPVVCGAGPAGPDGVVREWTVATFVLHRGRVLLLFHPKVGLWLPPGGHVEHGELPDEAAVREVLEETGVRCRLVGESGVDVEYPRQLMRPFGIQVENIRPGVQHIDLVYFAVSDDGGCQISEDSAAQDRAGWYAPSELPTLGANDEIRQWMAKLLAALGDRV